MVGEKGERRFIKGWLVKVGGGILDSNEQCKVMVCLNDL